MNIENALENHHDRIAVKAIDDAAIAELRQQVGGSVLLPGDSGYEAECMTFNLMSKVKPLIAVGVTSAHDVQACVRFAAKRRLAVGVLATGHQMPCSADRAVLINMSRMQAVQIDPIARLARVEGGTRWQHVLDETDTHGLAAVSGTSPTVGVVGYHLGGGASPILGRKYGYAADHIQAAEIVTADGQLRRITAQSQPDLFWALCGGKGNFGVVTALEFRLFPLERFYGGGLFFAGEHAAKVLHRWREWAMHLPIHMNTSVAFLRLPSLPAVPEPLRDKLTLHLRFSSLESQDEAEQTLADMRGVAPTVIDTVAGMRYRQSGSMFTDPPAPAAWVDRSTALRALPAKAIDALVAAIGPDSGSRLGFVELRLLGGALHCQPDRPNSIPGRSALWSVFGSGGGRPDLVAQVEENLSSLVNALAPWSQDEIMPNLLGKGQGATPAELSAIYGHERYERLVTLKRLYDPRNMFCVNHNIRSLT